MARVHAIYPDRQGLASGLHFAFLKLRLTAKYVFFGIALANVPMGVLCMAASGAIVLADPHGTSPVTMHWSVERQSKLNPRPLIAYNCLRYMWNAIYVMGSHWAWVSSLTGRVSPQRLPTLLCVLFSTAAYGFHVARILLYLVGIHAHAHLFAIASYACSLVGICLVIVTGAPTALGRRESLQWVLFISLTSVEYISVFAILFAYFHLPRFSHRWLAFHLVLVVLDPIMRHSTMLATRHLENKAKSRRQLVIFLELMIVIAVQTMQQGAHAWYEVVVLQASIVVHDIVKSLTRLGGQTEIQALWDLGKSSIRAFSDRVAIERVPPQQIPCTSTSCHVNVITVLPVDTYEIDEVSELSLKFNSTIVACMGLVKGYTLCMVACAYFLTQVTLDRTRTKRLWYAEYAVRLLVAAVSEQVVEIVVIAVHHRRVRDREEVAWDSQSLFVLAREEAPWLVLFCTAGTLDIVYGFVIAYLCPVADTSPYLTQCPSGDHWFW